MLLGVVIPMGCYKSCKMFLLSFWDNSINVLVVPILINAYSLYRIKIIIYKVTIFLHIPLILFFFVNNIIIS
jgi:hypothetical protein